MIYFTSDLHLNHNKEFIYKARGFDTVEQMNESIISNINSIVGDDDELDVLGDIFLGDNEEGIKLFSRINGNIHIILGNHDTDTREQIFVERCDKVCEVTRAKVLKYGKYRFYLSHYPTLTAEGPKEKMSLALINLFGHTHQTERFFNGNPFMYNVSVDAHGCKPVSIEDVINNIKERVNEVASSEESRRESVLKAKENIEDWLEYVSSLNECAFSDAMLFNAIKILQSVYNEE